MPRQREQCPFCRNEVEPARKAGVRYEVTCSTCGHFDVENALFAVSSAPESKQSLLNRTRVSGVIRETDELGREPLFIIWDNLAEIAALAPSGLDERARRLLMAIGRRTQYFGHDVQLTPGTDYPLGYCQNRHEFISMLQHLRDERCRR